MSADKKIKAFNYCNVSLKQSHWGQQFQSTTEYYLNIPDDSLLYGFRKRAGLPAPGEELGGWYGTGTFHIFGQILGSLAKMYSVTQDARLKKKATLLMEEWGKCIEPDGYGFKNKRGFVDDLCYEYEKLVGGLADIYEFLGNKDSEKYLSLITDWMIANKINIRAGEWYTLSENLYRAYLLTGDKKYKDYAEKFEYKEYWDLYLEDNPEFAVKHAYSHVNSLSSAAMAYNVKHDKAYQNILERAYKLLTDKYIYPATGTYGPAEELFGKDGYLGESVLGPFVRPLGCLGNAEVPCDSWAVFKLCRYLMEFTGDPIYGDWVEKILYNGIGAEIPLEPDGKVMYYANYHVYGAYKDVKIDQFCWANGTTMEWPCCTGTYPQTVTEYNNLVYFYNDDSLFISQYLPSNLVWEKDGSKITIDMETKYPEEEAVEVKIGSGKPAVFKIKLRIPTWVKELPTVSINGVAQEISVSPGQWLVLEKEWSNGDSIVLNIPMHLYFTRVDKQHPLIVALHYGPVVYASLSEGILKGNTANPQLWIKPIDNTNQIFETEPGHVKGYENVRKKFVPFYKIGPRERYYLYNQLDAVYK